MNIRKYKISCLLNTDSLIMIIKYIILYFNNLIKILEIRLKSIQELINFKILKVLFKFIWK